ncbi:MAG: ATP-binding protein [Burkholderiaceae bacterium]
MRLSLRRRGVFALLSVAAYIVFAGLALDSQRQNLRSLSLELEELHSKDIALGRTIHALHHSLIRAKELAAADGLRGSGADDVALDLELVHSGLIEVRGYSPAAAPDVERVEALVTRLRTQPFRELLAAVDQLEDDLDKRLTVVENELHDARAAVWERYHRAYDRMTLIGVMVNLVGVIVLGTLMTMFFSRLAWDINKLKDRSMAIVSGYRGPELAVTRGDEIGDLMQAVNHVQTELRERERKLEIAREQHYYREKMAAMGSLASAVAHEINNPIAAIAGIAQAMTAAQKTGRGADSKVVVEGPAMILEQAQRISVISRQIAEFTQPPANKPAMIDVNAIIRSTCKFVQYDRRLRSVELDLDLYKELPAVVAIADHVTQVLMNLLINAADALADVTARKPAIRIATYRGNDEVVMTVADNGGGMDSETLARAFDEAFTTKSADNGRGLGLFLCRSLLERSGGRIELQSTVGDGTTAIVRFPLRPATIAIDA